MNGNTLPSLIHRDRLPPAHIPTGIVNLSDWYYCTHTHRPVSLPRPLDSRNSYAQNGITS
jgi:hypothetical protein